MSTIYVKTTDTCNLNCDHCFTNGRNGSTVKWDWEATQKWVKGYLATVEGKTHIELHGGEPMLVPLETLERFCAPFKDDPRLSIGTTTNLVYKLYPEHLSFFKETLSGRIGTSWDLGIRFENNKQLSLWRDNVKRVKDAGVFVKLNVSVTKDVVAMSAKDFFTEMESIAPDEIALERLTSSGSAIENTSIFPDNNDQDLWYLELLKYYMTGRTTVKVLDFEVLVSRIKENAVHVFTNCRECEQKLVTISASGDLATCPNAALENKFGTVLDSVEHFLDHDGRIDEIAKEATPDERCVACPMFLYCGGDCHRLSWHSGRCGGLYHTLNYLVNGTEPGTIKKSRRIIPIKVSL